MNSPTMNAANLSATSPTAADTLLGATVRRGATEGFNMRFPSIKVVSAQLCAERASVNWRDIEENEGDAPYVDVRLQVYPDGTWYLHAGDSQYDLDHRGFWGSASIHEKMTNAEAREIARDLIAQCKEHAAEAATEKVS